MSPVFLVCLAKKEQKQERKEPGDEDIYIYMCVCTYIEPFLVGCILRSSHQLSS